MAYLVRIGNSQGIRIPKSFIEQADLEGKELKFEVVNGGLFIAPVNEPRKGWAESINKVLVTHG
ncbi:AbrB/MazE/SpoVT family DNA-binding domain-containing protein [Methyloprofundus sp.]|uniref:AbrB/MazE/SpoVT family DNA-binding domain-containing protein n=1 Tax=Methyloprofundus sp. TaxID=2020875 RepID=UPI003D144403